MGNINSHEEKSNIDNIQENIYSHETKERLIRVVKHEAETERMELRLQVWELEKKKHQLELEILRLDERLAFRLAEIAHDNTFESRCTQKKLIKQTEVNNTRKPLSVVHITQVHIPDRISTSEPHTVIGTNENYPHLDEPMAFTDAEVHISGNTQPKLLSLINVEENLPQPEKLMEDTQDQKLGTTIASEPQNLVASNIVEGRLTQAQKLSLDNSEVPTQQKQLLIEKMVDIVGSPIQDNEVIDKIARLPKDITIKRTRKENKCMETKLRQHRYTAGVIEKGRQKQCNNSIPMADSKGSAEEIGMMNEKTATVSQKNLYEDLHILEDKIRMYKKKSKSLKRRYPELLK